MSLRRKPALTLTASGATSSPRAAAKPSPIAKSTTADRQIDNITARFHLIAEHPKVGRTRDEDLGPGTRSFVAGDYVIVYDIDGNDVRMLRVVHVRRDLAALFGSGIS
jgi:toxin ParE1/3/4